MKTFIIISSALLSVAGLNAADVPQHPTTMNAPAPAANAPANSDAALQKKIHDKISSGVFVKGYDRVKVEVKNGDVLLTGSVNTAADKDKVEKEVRKVDGVKNVTDKVTVVPEK